MVRRSIPGRVRECALVYAVGYSVTFVIARLEIDVRWAVGEVGVVSPEPKCDRVGIWSTSTRSVEVEGDLGAMGLARLNVDRDIELDRIVDLRETADPRGSRRGRGACLRQKDTAHDREE